MSVGGCQTHKELGSVPAGHHLGRRNPRQVAPLPRNPDSGECWATSFECWTHLGGCWTHRSVLDTHWWVLDTPACLLVSARHERLESVPAGHNFRLRNPRQVSAHTPKPPNPRTLRRTAYFFQAPLRVFPFRRSTCHTIPWSRGGHLLFSQPQSRTSTQ